MHVSCEPRLANRFAGVDTGKNFQFATIQLSILLELTFSWNFCVCVIVQFFFSIQLFFFYLNFWSKVVGVQCTAALDAIKENMEHFNEWKFIAISALISIFLFFNMNIDFSPRPKKGFSIKEANLPLANRNHIHSFVIFKSHL